MLSAATLGESLRLALINDAGATDNEATERMALAIATKVIEHIVANAVVTVAPGIPVATAGSAAAQTGATTAPGTGTVA
jgi:hypothetical protein